jgi:hypothetical protein
MKKMMVLACTFMLLVRVVNAQEISATFGYASFSMGDLKDLNQEIVSNAELPSRVTDDFPGYFNAEISFTYPLVNEKYLTGVYVGFTSTGSRIAYNDYSGHQYFDQQLMGLSFGIQGQLPFNPDDRNVFGLKLKGGMVMTFHTIESELTIYSSTSSDNVKFRGNNFSLEPTFYFVRQLKSGPLALRAEAGYAANLIKGELFLNDDSNAYLTNSSGDPIHADWSGLRISVGISYTFSLR